MAKIKNFANSGFKECVVCDTMFYSMSHRKILCGDPQCRRTYVKVSKYVINTYKKKLKENEQDADKF